MKEQNRSATQAVISNAPLKRMLTGAAIALVVISFFIISGEQKPHPDWGKLWMLRPFVVVPAAGAFGGLVFYFINNQAFFKTGWRKALGIIIGVVAFVFLLWVGTIMGLSGTWWD